MTITVLPILLGFGLLFFGILLIYHLVSLYYKKEEVEVEEIIENEFDYIFGFNLELLDVLNNTWKRIFKRVENPFHPDMKWSEFNELIKQMNQEAKRNHIW